MQSGMATAAKIDFKKKNTLASPHGVSVRALLCEKAQHVKKSYKSFFILS